MHMIGRAAICWKLSPKHLNIIVVEYSCGYILSTEMPFQVDRKGRNSFSSTERRSWMDYIEHRFLTAPPKSTWGLVIDWQSISYKTISNIWNILFFAMYWLSLQYRTPYEIQAAWKCDEQTERRKLTIRQRINNDRVFTSGAMWVPVPAKVSHSVCEVVVPYTLLLMLPARTHQSTQS